jgi:AhpD family alkylhydroperoxidase
MTMSTATATAFAVPTRNDLSTESQALYDNIKAGFGKVPNLYAFMAHSANGLGSYLALQTAQAKGSFSAIEQQAIFLVVSQVNECRYCLAAHAYLGSQAGLSDAEMMDIRAGRSSDARRAAIVRLAQEVARDHGRPSSEAVELFFGEGFDVAALIDLVILVGDKIISNYVHNITDIEVDFPAAPTLV